VLVQQTPTPKMKCRTTGLISSRVLLKTRILRNSGIYLDEFYQEKLVDPTGERFVHASACSAPCRIRDNLEQLRFENARGKGGLTRSAVRGLRMAYPRQT